jgi:predicted RNA-binding Zn-ribbon protein involved in translation (DUF1610 family)
VRRVPPSRVPPSRVPPSKERLSLQVGLGPGYKLHGRPSPSPSPRPQSDCTTSNPATPHTSHSSASCPPAGQVPVVRARLCRRDPRLPPNWDYSLLIGTTPSSHGRGPSFEPAAPRGPRGSPSHTAHQGHTAPRGWIHSRPPCDESPCVSVPLEGPNEDERVLHRLSPAPDLRLPYEFFFLKWFQCYSDLRLPHGEEIPDTPPPCLARGRGRSRGGDDIVLAAPKRTGRVRYLCRV